MNRAEKDSERNGKAITVVAVVSRELHSLFSPILSPLRASANPYFNLYMETTI
jgi:hypothetical protein